MKRSIDNGFQGRTKKGQLITAPTKNWRFSASYDSFYGTKKVRIYRCCLQAEKKKKMAHSINAIILKGNFDKDEAEKYELIEVKLDFNLSMFFINGFYTACWQKKIKYIWTIRNKF